MECSCETCKSACSYRAGWFLPGEVAKAAALLGMEPQTFFDKYVCVDYWGAGGDDIDHNIFVLAPATHNCTPGTNYPYNPKGICTFYQNERCSIHAAKPHECGHYDHNSTNEEIASKHKEVALAWDNPAAQQEIRDYLGEEPCAAEPESFFDSFRLMF